MDGYCSEHTEASPHLPQSSSRPAISIQTYRCAQETGTLPIDRTVRDNDIDRLEVTRPAALAPCYSPRRGIFFVLIKVLDCRDG